MLWEWGLHRNSSGISFHCQEKCKVLVFCRVWSFHVHAPTFCPAAIWAISPEVCGKPFEADDFLGACCRKATWPPKSYGLYFFPSIAHTQNLHKISVSDLFRRQPNYIFGESMWVFWPSPSSGERAQWVPLSLLFVCQSELAFFCRAHRVYRRTQWVLSSETGLSKQYSARFLLFVWSNSSN